MLISSMPVAVSLKRGFESLRPYNKRVSYNGITLDFQSKDESSILSTRSNNGPDANGRSTDLQSDRLGSIPTVSTKKLKKRFGRIK